MGQLFVFLYVLLSSSKAVYLSHLFQSLDPIVVLFYTFLVAWLIFFALSIAQRRLHSLVQIVSFHRRDVLLLNLWTALSWFTFYAAIKYLEPGAHAVIANASQPLLTFLLSGLAGFSSRKGPFFRRGVRSFYLAGLLLIAGSVLLQITIVLLGKSALGPIPTGRSLLGMGLSALCAFSLAMNRKTNYRLQKVGLSASDFMSIRLLGLLVAAFVIRFPYLGFTGRAAASLLFAHASTLGLVGLFGVTLPVYFLQKGQVLTDELSAALIISLMPLTMLLLQLLDDRLVFSVGSTIAIVLATVGTNFVFFAKHFWIKGDIK